MQILEQSGRRLVVLAGQAEASKDSMLSSAARMSAPGRSIRLLNAELVFGMDHIKAAFQKASRAFDNRQNVSDSLATETMLYMSGCRQIQEAVELFNLEKGRGSIVCLADQDGSEGDLAGVLRIREDDKAMDASDKDIRGFGISQEEIGTVPDSRKADLVLERVAGVDIKKK